MRGAIFDMDGTLLDSMHIWDDIGASFLRAKGVVPPDDLYEMLKPLSLVQCAQYFREKLGIDQTCAEMMAEINRMVEGSYAREVELKPGAAAFLNRLREQGVAMCVATASDRPLVEAALGRLGVLDCFAFVTTCTEVGAGKDQPDIFERACERLGTPKAETVVFEDALHAIETAKAAGFPIAAVQDSSARGDEDNIRALADWYIESYERLEGINL